MSIEKAKVWINLAIKKIEVHQNPDKAKPDILSDRIIPLLNEALVELDTGENKKHASTIKLKE